MSDPTPSLPGVGAGLPGLSPGGQDLSRQYDLTRQHLGFDRREITVTDAVQATVNSLVDRLLVGRRLFEVIHTAHDVPSDIVWAKAQAPGGAKAEEPAVEVSAAQIAAPSTRLWATVEMDESEIDLRAGVARSVALVDVAQRMALEEDRVIFGQAWAQSAPLPSSRRRPASDADPAVTMLTAAFGALRQAGHRGGIALLLATGVGYRDIESELAAAGALAQLAPLFALGIHAVPLGEDGAALVAAPEGSGASITVGQNYAVSCLECSGSRLRFGICTTFGVCPGAATAQCRLSVPAPSIPLAPRRK